MCYFFWAIDQCADLIQCTLSGFLSANDTNPTMNILSEAPWYSVNATNTTWPITVSCINTPSPCSSTWGAARIQVVAMQYVNITVPTPWEYMPSYVEAYGSTYFGRGCDAASSNITLQTFAQKSDWNTTAPLKTVTVSCALTPRT
jgi:hypothetical protein